MNKFAKVAIENTMQNDYNPLILCGDRKKSKKLVYDYLKKIYDDYIYQILDEDDFRKERIEIDFSLINLFVIDALEIIEQEQSSQRKLLYVLDRTLKLNKKVIIFYSKDIKDIIIDKRIKDRLMKGLILYI